MLPSQIGRPAGSRSHMYRRTRSRKTPFIILAIAVFAVTFAVIRFWPGAGGSGAVDSAGAAPVNPPSGAAPASVVNKIADDHAKPKSTPPNSAGNARSNSNPEKISMGAAAPRNGNNQTAKPVVHEPPAPPPQPAAAPETKTNTQFQAPTISAPPIASEPSIAFNSREARSSQRLAAGMDLLARNKPLEARRMLTEALTTEKLSPADADKVRHTLATLNQKMVFAPDVIPGDPFARTYTVEDGDVLVRLPKKLGLKTDYRFLQRINNLPSDSLRIGQRLKVVTGPFHAMIVKREFRMDLFQGDDHQRVYICSFPVGLGEYGATPEGVFTVRPNSKLIDPEWVNPRTGERFTHDDPNNPIGERWIGLVGVSENIRDLSGYGIHGTIDPDSIGQQKSMGCIRMKAEDVEVVYELLMDNLSRIEIHGEDYP